MAKFVAYTGREELANLTFEWNISELEQQIKTGKVGESVKLEDVNVGETKWELRVFPNGHGKTAAAKDAVGVNVYSLNKAPVHAIVSLSVKNTESSASVYRKLPFTYTFAAITKGTLNGYGFDKFLTHKKIKDDASILSNGSLHLVIKMTVFGEVKTTRRPIHQDIGSTEIQERLRVTEHLKDSWTNDKFSDVHIKCGGQIFYCHRVILSKRSLYFSSMLESGMKESDIRVIDLVNIDVDILKAILKYIYGGEIDSLETNAVNLLKAAGMLILEDLKIICEKYLLANHMKLENVIDVVVMAEAHNAGHLKKGAMEMIVANSNDIVKQDGWKEKLALANSPMLGLEIFEAMTANKAI